MRAEIKYGLINAVLVCAWSLGEFFLGLHTRHMQYSDVSSLLSTVIPLAVLVRALNHRRRAAADGRISLTDGAKVGLILGVVTGVVLVVYFQIYFRWINPDWLRWAEAYERQKLLAAGKSPGEIQAALTRLRRMQDPMWQSLTGFFGTVVLDVTLALVLTLFLSRFSKKGGQPPRRPESAAEAAQ